MPVKLKIFTFQFSESAGGFDDAALQAFIADKEVVDFQQHFFNMDDMLLLSSDKQRLWQAAAAIEAYLADQLRLRVKPGSVLLAPVHQGLPFLGFRLFPGLIRIDRRGWRRFRRRIIHRDAQLASGDIDPETWQRSVASLVGHLQQAQTRNLRASFFKARGNNRGAQRVIRGGSWNNDAHNCRSATRNNNSPGNRNNNLGFRLSSSRPPAGCGAFKDAPPAPWT
jgi:hypothetical protein